MSCPRNESLHGRGLSAAEMKAFTEHALECETCGPVIESVRGARKAMNAFPPPLTDARKREMLGRIKGATAAPANDRTRSWAAAIAIAAAVLFVAGTAIWQLSRPAEDPTGASEIAIFAEQTKLEPEQTYGFHGARFETSRSAVLTRKAANVLALDEGDLEITLGASPQPRPLVIVTGEHQVTAEAAAFRIAVDATGTVIRVASGRVTITGPSGPRTVAAGAEITLTPEEAARVEHDGPSVAVAQTAAPQKIRKASRRRAVPSTRSRLRRRVAKSLVNTPKPAPRRDESSPEEPPEIRTPKVDTPEIPTPKIEDARAMVRQDAERAKEMAQAILRESPPAPIEVEALLVLADALRRRGAHADAAVQYRRVAEHREGYRFLEEAGYREAEMRLATGDLPRARNVLRAADARFGRGQLGRERTDLLVRLSLRVGAPGAAADALASWDDDRTSRRLGRLRLDVAQALYSTDAERARRLLEMIDVTALPALAARARDLSRKFEEK